MSKINKTRHSRGWLALLIPLALLDFGLLIFNLIYGKNIALFDSKGLIAHEQRGLMIFIMIVMLGVALPVVIVLYLTAWKYRETNTKAVHDPNATQGKFAVGLMWVFPVVIMLALAPILWSSTHRLQPHTTLSVEAEPMTIQVISMRWKWVFIYPGQKIATVNFVQIPVNTPVTFELTADEAPMSSFWIPNLGGQLYSMTSHINRLNLIGETTGDYPGSSAELNGAGFSGMKFTTRVSSVEDFAHWVNDVKQSKTTLDSATYDTLVKPSEDNVVVLYSDYQSDLYGKVIEKYMGSHMSHVEHEVHR